MMEVFNSVPRAETIASDYNNFSKEKCEQALWASFHMWKIKLDTLDMTHNLFFCSQLESVFIH